MRGVAEEASGDYAEVRSRAEEARDRGWWRRSSQRDLTRIFFFSFTGQDDISHRVFLELGVWFRDGSFCHSLCSFALSLWFFPYFWMACETKIVFSYISFCYLRNWKAEIKIAIEKSRQRKWFGQAFAFLSR
jgi:hypothetical protein